MPKIAGFSPDIENSRAEAKRLLKEAGAEGLSFELLKPCVAEGERRVDRKATTIVLLVVKNGPPSNFFYAIKEKRGGRSRAELVNGVVSLIKVLAEKNERIGGSRAQHDLIEFTLLKAYLGAGRLDEAKRLLRARRSGASGVPVTGIAAVQ